MDEAERRRLSASLQIRTAAPTDPDSLWCRDRYFDELNRRFPGGFDAGPGGAGGADADTDMTAPAGRFVLARIEFPGNVRPVGCGGVVVRTSDAGPAFAEIKRMWVDDTLRGLGIGYRILNALEVAAHEMGCHLLRLDSNGALPEARALYRRCGYAEIPRYNDNPYAQLWFEKSVG
ncbi:MAG: GNAT family N-acetyltransferase [Alphaproteobacteria bacterium]